MQPRQRVVGVAVRSQIGVVGFVQSAASFALQPPQAPLGVQTGFPGQLSGVNRHASQVSVVALQIGVLPPQPALLSSGSQAAQLPFTHCVWPARPAQSVASRHSPQLLVPPLVMQ